MVENGWILAFHHIWRLKICPSSKDLVQVLVKDATERRDFLEQQSSDPETNWHNGILRNL